MNKAQIIKKEYQKIYYDKNREILLQKQKEYKDERREYIREQNRLFMIDYRKNHAEEMKEYRENHQERAKETDRIYKLEHKEQIQNLSKEYRRTHKPERNELLRNKRKTDINFKLMDNLRCRLRNAIKGNSKSENTIKLIGCSIEFFKKYYESKFTEGMSWDKVMNSEIHCDHIRPCASFDLSKPEEQCKCFHYTNLQPLWAVDNLRKSDKYE